MAAVNDAEEIVFEPERFSNTCNKLYSKWKSDNESDAWGNSCDALVIISGSTNEDEIRFPKSSALQVDTLLAFCEESIIVLAATKKAKLLQNLAGSLGSSFKYKMHVLTRDKTDKDSMNFTKVIEFLKSSNKGAKIGSNIKDKNEGSFAAAWNVSLKASGLEVSDISNGIGDILAIKTEDQLKSVREGSSIAVQAVKKYVIEEILNLIDDKKEAKMTVLIEGVEDRIFQLAKESKLSEADMEVITPPILQSGGVYDLKYTAQTSDTPLHLPDKDGPAVHIIAISIRNKFCCSTVARTLFFNAKKEQQENYKLLLDIFDECIALLQPGIRLNKIYESAARTLKTRRPDLLGNFIKELGWGMGYELRDKKLVLDEKNRNTAQVGMTFCFRLGFENLKLAVKDSRSQQYSILISDTVILGENGAEVTTNNLFKKFNKVSWNVSDEPVEEKKPEKKEQISTQDILARLGQDKTRKVSESDEAERRKLFEEQNEKLARRRIEEQKRLISGKGEGDYLQSKIESQTSGYGNPGDFPTKASGNAIYVDEDRQSVLVPINGCPVPFHISVLKNVTKQEAANVSILRINFVTPGLGVQLGADSKTYMYLRELCFRSQESVSLGLAHKQIMDLKKHFNQNETLLKAKADIVPQEPLRINPNRGPQLQNVRIYPNIQARGKKTEGNLEAHVNGFRFSIKKAASSDVKHVDLLYRNVKHAFFQPSNKSSAIILVHFRLINPIMVGKASTKDLQFYVEYLDEGESLMDNRKRNTWDRDEVEDESRHKTMVAQLDAQFKKFTDKVTEVLPPADPSEPDGDKIWDWDIPYNELEFQGNPKNSMVELYPTTSCIVHLATKPVCIIDLEKVDVAYYERIQSGNRNFDLAFVFKDFLLPDAKIQEGTTWIRINSIDIKYYDQVREVLQKSKLPQFEGTAPLKWNDVLKQYRKNFDDITQDGGWVCILGQGDDEEQEEEQEDEDDESFTADDEDSDGSSEDDSEDSDLSEYSEDDSDEMSDEELSSEGMDSDEAEAWAEEEDKRGREKALEKGGIASKPGKKSGHRDRSPRSDDSDDERPRKKSSHPPPKGGSRSLGSKSAGSSNGGGSKGARPLGMSKGKSPSSSKGSGGGSGHKGRR